MPETSTFAVLFLAALWAGCQNALAGGGSFLTLPALILTGMDARAANITSTVALFPSQVTTGIHGWKQSTGAGGLSRGWLVGISLVGGVLGAVLLLLTPSSIFAHMVPWLVLFATVMFAWGSFMPKRADGGTRLKAGGAGVAQFCIAVYGGYFGGGIGFLMLAALTAAGLSIRSAAATKNVLAAVMNLSAVLIFVFSPEVYWLQMAIACVAALIGGLAGAHMLNKVNEKALRIFIVVIGVALTIGLFIRAQ
jgi:uncharacterized membrane protein YfcA